MSTSAGASPLREGMPQHSPDVPSASVPIPACDGKEASTHADENGRFSEAQHCTVPLATLPSNANTNCSERGNHSYGDAPSPPRSFFTTEHQQATPSVNTTPTSTPSTPSTSTLPDETFRHLHSSVSTPPRIKKIFFDEREGLSPELGGFGHYAGSITAFMDPNRQKKAVRGLGSGGATSPLPCEVAEVQEQAIRAQQVQAASMEEVIQKGGPLPSPKHHRTSGMECIPQGGATDHLPRIQLAAARKPPSFLQAGAAAALGTDASGALGSTSTVPLPGASAIHMTKPSGRVGVPSSSSASALGEHRGPVSLNRREMGSSGGREVTDTIHSDREPLTTSSSSTLGSGKVSHRNATEERWAGGSILSSATPHPTTTPASASQTLSKSEWNKEAEDYYRSLPKNPLTKEEMWERIQAASADKQERLEVGRGGSRGEAKTGKKGGGKSAVRPFSSFSPGVVSLDIAEVDMIKMKEDLKEHDRWHYELGEYAFKDEEEESGFWFRGKLGEEEEERVLVARKRRYDYYTMWSLAMALNKARWSMLEVHSQRGVKTTGAGMKLLFWKEAIRGILQSGSTSGTNFTDSHPVLQPFSRVVSRHPKLTKAFVRGFTDARLRTLQQPANMQQLFDHFDKFYGYFYNSLLEVTQLQDEAAEHALLHIGRATGLTQHCVMFWKKYAALGVTLLPADMCADHCVHLGLLKRLSLASRDRAVRRLLCDVMGVAKTEMLHAEKLAKDINPKTWPILMECLYPNYYLHFLQKRDFNVSAMFADYNIENMGFVWFRIKKRLEWQRERSIAKLLSDAAPVPILNRPIFCRGSAYKMATHTRGSAPT